jgi:hypothetical protein
MNPSKIRPTRCVILICVYISMTRILFHILLHTKDSKMLKERPCQHCSKTTRNPKFCSYSCSATVRNKNYHSKKPLKEYKCKKCKKYLSTGWWELKKTGNQKVCDDCNQNKVDWSKISLKELRIQRKQVNLYHARLRALSRTTYKQSGKPLCCKVCQYKTYVEICHIKPVNSFSEDTSVATVNHIDNLVALCRNHHWEFDNGIIQI